MGITSKEQKEEVVNILLKTIDTVKKRQEEEYYKELATIITGLNGGEKTSSMALKSKAIDDKYKEILAHLNSENKSGSISNEEFEKLNADAELKQQAERNALLLAGINDYKSKESALLAEWDAKIAQAQGNSNALSLLETGKANALNGLHLEAVKGMGEWSELFTNLDLLTSTRISELSQSIQQKSKDLKLDPIKSGEVVKELDKASAVIRSRDPFSSLALSLRNYKNAENDTFKRSASKNMMKDTAASLDMVNGMFTSVSSGLKGLGLAGDETTQAIMADVVGLIGSASQLATGIATANPLAIIQGTFGVVTSVFSLFDGKTRRANEVIRENAVELKKLDIAYKDLEESMKSALGEDHFRFQLEQMKNLEKQKEKIQNQINAENSKSKKKKDNSKIEGFEKTQKELEYKANEVKNRLLKDLLTTDVGAVAKTIADGIITGFENGFADAKGVVDKSVDDLMKKIIARQFEVLVVQKALDPFQKRAEKAAEDGKFMDEEIEDLSVIGKATKDDIANGWKQYEVLLNKSKPPIKYQYNPRIAISF